MQGLIGKKIGMTSVFAADGKNVPCTVIEVGPCVVTQIKTHETDGYEAVQVAFDDKKEKNTPKPMLGHFKKADTTPKRKVAEFKMDSGEEIKLGDVLTVDNFSNDLWVDVTGTSKGKGFQGVVRRHNFSGGPAGHGGGWQRRSGSIGQKELPGNIIKGKRMPGHMGNVPRTIQNLIVVKVSPDENLLFIKGAVPGPTGSILSVRSAIKKSNKKK